MSHIPKQPVASEQLMKRKGSRLNWKLLIKIVLTAVALYWVFRQVNLRDIGQYIIKAPIHITVASILLYNVAKLMGAYRLNLFFKAEGISLPEKENIKLYYKGMFTIFSCLEE